MLLLVGVPLALPLIVLTWLAAFFPIIGAVIAGAAAVLVALVANGPTEALIVGVAIVVVQQVEGKSSTGGRRPAAGLCIPSSC